MLDLPQIRLDAAAHAASRLRDKKPVLLQPMFREVVWRWHDRIYTDIHSLPWNHPSRRFINSEMDRVVEILLPFCTRHYEKPKNQCREERQRWLRHGRCLRGELGVGEIFWAGAWLESDTNYAPCGGANPHPWACVGHVIGNPTRKRGKRKASLIINETSV